MSIHQAFKRQAVPAQAAIQMQATTVPAPMRGLHLEENAAFMQPGGAVVLDNWLPTLRGIKLRGGSKLWCTLPETTPIISGFEYVSGVTRKMFACNATKVYDVTATTPISVATGRTSGNYVACQLANQSGKDYLTAANQTGDYLLRYDGTAWTVLNASQITTDPAITPPPTCATGQNLTYVWKYRNRLFFIEGGTMNAWYLPTNAVTGVLELVPLSGAATKGGFLMWGSTWSLDAGDGIDEKCVFATSEGELLIFTGTNPADAANWHQEGRYATSKPMGMNAHIQVGGDILIATIDGIIPISAAITKDIAALQLAAITTPIAPLWQAEVADKNARPWTMRKWDSFGGMLVTLPGKPTDSDFRCFAVNTNTISWCRITGWDAQCWMMNDTSLFFGTTTGKVIQANVTGYDDGSKPYTAVMVGGWEMFKQPSSQVTWYQARAVFTSRANEPFIPQISACTDFVIELPPIPSAGVDPGSGDYWDEGLWDTARWDAAALSQNKPIRNTMWVSVGQTGFTHAPILQVTVAQGALPTVELISIAATYSVLGINV